MDNRYCRELLDKSIGYVIKKYGRQSEASDYKASNNLTKALDTVRGSNNKNFYKHRILIKTIWPMIINHENKDTMIELLEEAASMRPFCYEGFYYRAALVVFPFYGIIMSPQFSYVIENLIVWASSLPSNKRHDAIRDDVNQAIDMFLEYES